MQTFIIFEGNDEVIITTPSERENTIKLYFTNGGRDLEEYDEKEATTTAIQVRLGVTQVAW